MRASYLFHRQYAPCKKWLFRGFSSLPNLPPGLVKLVKMMAQTVQLDRIEVQLMNLLQYLADMANASGLIEPAQVDMGPHFSFGPFYYYTGTFCERFEAILPESVRGKPYEGPADMRLYFG